MTNGSSQGLFVIVAVVIFGIFILISYLLFRDKLQTGLASIFTDSITEAKPIDNYFNNNIREKEYVATKKEFLNSTDWDLSKVGDAFNENQEYTITFEIKTEVSGNVTFYTQNNDSTEYIFSTTRWITISSNTEYKKYAINFKLSQLDGSVATSYIGFYGVYGSGAYPTVKNMKLSKGNTLATLDDSYKKVDTLK